MLQDTAATFPHTVTLDIMIAHTPGITAHTADTDIHQLTPVPTTHTLAPTDHGAHCPPMDQPTGEHLDESVGLYNYRGQGMIMSFSVLIFWRWFHQHPILMTARSIQYLLVDKIEELTNRIHANNIFKI